ncbi:MAG: hydantoinase/oxoprolinase family protein [Nitrososphaerales archaeon]|nr:hydantoinase/oxoprolinase family protein [Nitrososphaerales archaeon]
MPLRVAIDIGGGFTDLIAVDEQTGEMVWSKGQTTPADLTQGIVDVFKMSKVDPSSCAQLLHGQTVVINAVLQRRGAKVGLITTKGFRDILAIQRANRRDIFNLRYKKPEPFVPRYLRTEVDERTMSDGSVLKQVDASDAVKAYRSLKAEGAESVAICFINSYMNPSNERTALRAIRGAEEANEGAATISSDVTREWREYERTSTAVLNAYVMPLIGGYLARLKDEFGKLNFRGVYYMMLSSGGVASFDLVRSVPIQTIESGPVAGVVAGVKIAELMGEENVIVLDGGSTTTKASLVEGLTIKFTTDYSVEKDEFKAGYPVKVPIVDIVEIGNGGGSIAWVDEVGNLRVGPRSAGADPGPACYGKGGTEPTLTDAYLAVGFLNPKYFLGGQVSLNLDLAVMAVSKIAQRFQISLEEAAFAIIRLANDNASQVLRLISVQRGYDPRDFALIAHGGSGPMLSPFIVEELEIPRVIIPIIPPGNFSAWGLLMSDLRQDRVKTVVKRLDSVGIEDSFNAGYNELEDEITSLYRDEGTNEGVVLRRNADLRYYGQEHTIRVFVDRVTIDASGVKEIGSRFQARHHKEYGFTLDGPVELVNLHVSGIVAVKKPAVRVLDTAGSIERAVKGERMVFWGDGKRTSTRIFERGKIPALATIEGPAIIEEPTSTSLVRKGRAARTDKYGNLVIRVA